MNHKKSHFASLISKESADHYAAMFCKNASCYAEKLFEDKKVGMVSFVYNGKSSLLSFCLPSGAQNKTASEVVRCADRISVTGGATLFRFETIGAAKAGALCMIYAAANKSRTDILSVRQSDIGVSVCVCKNVSAFEREIRRAFRSVKSGFC